MRVAAHAGRRAQTVMGWGQASKKRGPDALVYRRQAFPLRATIEASLGKAVHEAAGRATAPPLGPGGATHGRRGLPERRQLAARGGLS